MILFWEFHKLYGFYDIYEHIVFPQVVAYAKKKKETILLLLDLFEAISLLNVL